MSLTRRDVIVAGALLGTAALTAGCGPAPDRELPLAVVYRGPASKSGCPEAVAAVLSSGPSPYRVEYVGPEEERPLTREGLAGAAVYAQPGGGSVQRAWRHLAPDADMIHEYTVAGGVYLGFCLGAYLAGRTPGFALVDGDTEQYVGSPGASVDTTDDTIVTVRWRGVRRRVYFQDGPIVRLSPTGSATGDVLAVYEGGAPAAVVAPAGRGRVGLVGPHPEATPAWYSSAGLIDEEPAGQIDLARDLVATATRSPRSTP